MTLETSPETEAPAPVVNPNMHWFVVQAYSQYENKVSKAMRERITRAGLDEHFGRIVVPTEEVVEMREGVKRTVERKFYPGYVFVQMVLNEDTWHLIMSTPNVLGFIGGTKERPVPIHAREAAQMLGRVDGLTDKPKPKTLYEPGQSIRITEGPFADFEGVVEEINVDKQRLRVSVTIFGRPTPVDLDFVQVEKV